MFLMISVEDKETVIVIGSCLRRENCINEEHCCHRSRIIVEFKTTEEPHSKREDDMPCDAKSP